MDKSLPDVYLNVTTANPYRSLTRLVEYFHRTTASPGYYSDGSIRASSPLCIFQLSVSGSGETWVGDKYYRVGPGYGFINIVNRADSGYRYPPDADERWEFVTLCFEGGNVREVFGELIKRRGPVFRVADRLPEYMRMAADIEARPAYIYSQNESNGYYVRLLRDLVGSDSGGDLSDGLIETVHTLTDELLTDGVNVAEIAYRTGMSREHLSRLYKKRTGRTLQSYIISRQVERVCRLLSDPGVTVAEAARLMRMDYPSNLTAFFKRYTGMTPTAYRESQLK